MKKLNNNILFTWNLNVYLLIHKNCKRSDKETARAVTGGSTFRHLSQSWDDREKLFFKC